MIEKMAKIRMVGPKGILDQVADRLQSAGVMHIESAPLDPETAALERFSLPPEQQEMARELQGLVREIDRLLLSLPAIRGRSVDESFLSSLSQDLLEALRQIYRATHPSIDAALKAIRDAEEEQALLSKYERVLEALSPLLENIRESRTLDYLGLVLNLPADQRGQVEGAASVRAIRQMLSELTSGRYELFLIRVDAETLAGLLIVPREFSATVRSALWEENISELRLPAPVSDRPIRESLQYLLKRRLQLPDEIRGLRQSLMDLAGAWRARLELCAVQGRDWLERMESEVTFYQTRSTFIVYGWVPEPRAADLEALIRRTFQGTVVIQRVKILADELRTIPVKLRNPPVVAAFERLTRLVALPRYGSMDPTPYLAFFFPIFFGMIVGDIGYGMLMFALAILARRKWADMGWVRDLATVLLPSSLLAILFGVAYGEFFGALGERFGIHPIVVNRMDSFIPLLGFMLVVGWVHLCLGVSLGLATAIKYKDSRQAAVKICGLILLGSLAFFLGGIFGWIGAPVLLGAAAVALMSVIGLFYWGGGSGAMELHNVVNVLSYLRLMGIGAASAALAFAANTLGGLTGSLILGALVGGMLHGINLVFGIFSPAIQSLRLHYVEFFENFLERGGREYRPFKKA